MNQRDIKTTKVSRPRSIEERVAALETKVDQLVDEEAEHTTYLEEAKALGWANKDILETAVADMRNLLGLPGVSGMMGPRNARRGHEYLDAILHAYTELSHGAR